MRLPLLLLAAGFIQAWASAPVQLQTARSERPADSSTAAPVLGAELAAGPGLFALAAILGKNELQGPVEAEVLRVVDGDTLTVRAKIWIGQELTTNVRLFGVNAPELSGGCDRERTLAEAARRFLADRVEGRPVTLRKIALDKFGGRVIAVVEDGAGDLASALLAAQLAVPYDGGRRGSWCE